MNYRQCRLQADTTTQVCWLNDRPDLAIGKYVTLKGEDNTRWKIISMGEAQDLPIAAQSQSYKWHEHDDHRRHITTS